jgi:hypothetical protein
MPVVFISTPDCVGQGTTLVNYSAKPFGVDNTGAYDIEITATSGGLTNASFYVYENTFDPNNGLLNCIAGSNTSPAAVTGLALNSTTQYFLVTFDDSMGQTTNTTPGTYTVSFDGPGSLRGTTFHYVPINPWPIGLLLLLVGVWAIRRQGGRNS